jgi:hypothetical protein
MKLFCLKCSTFTTGTYTKADVELTTFPNRIFVCFLCSKHVWTDITNISKVFNEIEVKHIFNIDKEDNK